YGSTGDGDNDGVPDSTDNCPTIANPDQADRNLNGTGNACDDPDQDGLSDAYELYATYGPGPNFRVTNPDKKDTDSDGLSDGYEVNRVWGGGRHTDPTLRDTDADGWDDGTEVYANTDPTNRDTDGDGVSDPMDNCANAANTNQADTDRDGKGDVCDDDPGFPPPPPNVGDPTGAVDDAVATVQSKADEVVRQISGLVDIHPVGDLNKMATDGYAMRISQAGTIPGSGSDFTLQVYKDGAPVALNLPALTTYSNNGPVAVFAFRGDDTPLAGDRINMRWRYNAKAKVLTIRPNKGVNEQNVAVTFAVPPVGYPTGECRTVPNPVVKSTCDGYALGFYNPANTINPVDALDAVPFITIVTG
ncbi:MAG: hypothetical protein QOI20_1639, partial [Acidimicrobiaceae bacterium]|nr:hypothetical protein [Acidimicrobiaceae bacterium]